MTRRDSLRRWLTNLLLRRGLWLAVAAALCLGLAAAWWIYTHGVVYADEDLVVLHEFQRGMDASVATSRDGRLLAASAWTFTGPIPPPSSITIWDLPSRTLLREFG